MITVLDSGILHIPEGEIDGFEFNRVKAEAAKACMGMESDVFICRYKIAANVFSDYFDADKSRKFGTPMIYSGGR